MRLIIIAILLSLLTACTSPTPLSAGLSARMDVKGAQLNRADAIAIINDFRASKGIKPLSLDSQLNDKAQKLARIYSQTGNSPKKPASISAIRASAGYVNFAQTFSGWRAVPSSANALINPKFNIAGLGVAYNANSINGTYWILLLDEEPTKISAQ